LEPLKPLELPLEECVPSADGGNVVEEDNITVATVANKSAKKGSAKYKKTSGGTSAMGKLKFELSRMSEMSASCANVDELMPEPYLE
jgi:hypothetical protein